MSQEDNALIAAKAMEAAEAAMEIACKARGIDPMDLSDEEFDFFNDTALVEAFSPHTKMSEIWKGAKADMTIGDLKRDLEARAARRG
jgi:hypothetical protein